MREYVKTLADGYHVYFEAKKPNVTVEEAFGGLPLSYSKMIGKVNEKELEFFVARISVVSIDTGDEIGFALSEPSVYSKARNFIKESIYMDELIDKALGKDL